MIIFESFYYTSFNLNKELQFINIALCPYSFFQHCIYMCGYVYVYIYIYILCIVNYGKLQAISIS